MSEGMKDGIHCFGIPNNWAIGQAISILDVEADGRVSSAHSTGSGAAAEGAR